MKRFFALAFLMLAACETPAAQLAEPRTITLAGDLTRADHQTYREIPFVVPRGVTSLSVELSYDKADRTVIDMGLRDPLGQRGWSGGNKSGFTINRHEATLSYAPGAIQPGEWRLILGVPNIREGSVAHFEAKVTLDTAPVSRPEDYPRAHLAGVLDPNPGWRRGDFHMHTGHSDGSCDLAEGKRGPCPVLETVSAAQDAKLDFIAVTDHNTLTQRSDLGIAQFASRSLLLIPGTEVTTFWGHANAINLSKPIEFQLGSPRLPDTKALVDEVEAQGAFLSINHPGQPSGEVCMGCGWTAEIDYSRVSAIEVVNGSTLRLGNAEAPTSGIPFWDDKLRKGFRITAIGGSDNHDARDRKGERQSPIGRPATVVWTDKLSAKAVVAGVKSGRVFIDVAGMPGAILDAEATAPGQAVKMGGTLKLGRGEMGRIAVHTQETRSGQVKLVSYNLSIAEPDFARPDGPEAVFELSPGAAFGYVRPEVRDAAGKLILLGNPVYVVRR